MSVQFKLKQFEGPLDLLLHLIEKAKVDIKDIFVSEITEQFLEYMRYVDELDMDAASEFLTMAATLVYIKSRTLVPKPVVDEEDDEPAESPEDALIRRLEEYKKLKAAAGKLVEMRESAAGVYFKLPEEYHAESAFILEDATVTLLRQAFMDVMARSAVIREYNEPKRKTITRDMFTVTRKMEQITRSLKLNKRVSFFSLFESAASRLEKIVTFMAILELVHLNTIRVSQKKTYEDIFISAVG